MSDATPDRPSSPFQSADWLDPLEQQVRQGIRSLIERLVETELDAALGRQRYGREGQVAGYRHGRRDRQLLGTFGPTTVSLPRARLIQEDAREQEWKSRVVPAYKRLTKRAEALIAGVYLAGTNTRRIRRAIPGGSVGQYPADPSGNTRRVRRAIPGGSVGRCKACLPARSARIP